MDKKYRRLKAACYTTNIAQSAVANISPLLFLTFRSLYGLSYSLLGLLVLINFCTQLVIDLIFSFFSHRFNITKAVKITPMLTVLGFLIFALWPFFSPQSAVIGIVLGTIVFSASGGFAEVLISPVIAEIPAENPDHEMSKLHSVYAWGVVFVIVVGTLFMLVFGAENWQYLILLLTVIPLMSAILFAGAEIPEMKTPEKVSGALKFLKNKGVWFCFVMMFLGGASECTMAQWSSSYLEKALGIPKVWGDIFGVAMFGVMLGLGRSLYAKIGKNIEKVLLFGAAGAVICYLTAALSPVPVIGLAACAFTGFCTSMLWPGTLIVASDKFPESGVFIYALMAAGGDLGASVVPQLTGIVTDSVMGTGFAAEIAQSLAITAEQIGMKAGMLVGMFFPLIGMFLYLYLYKHRKK